MEKASKRKMKEIVIEPSPQRVRNMLTLEERVRAIQAYDCRPMYTKVAKMFNCSWEQIKNIIANRDAIMEFYAATKNQPKKPTYPCTDDIRLRKITFLGECLYEYIQRAQFHTRVDLTEELIRMKAFEFRDIMQIDNFTPNRAWMNHLKATFDFSLSNRQITLTRTPPASLDLKDIMTYCTKNMSKMEEQKESNDNNVPQRNLYREKTKKAVSNANDATLAELMQRRQRKINFLEKALHEYLQRAHYHHKMLLNEELLRRVVNELKDMLKIDNFVPNKAWLNHFKNRFNFNISQGMIVVTRTPPFSLDLKDILSYCSRNENKAQAPSTVTLAPKETVREQQKNVLLVTPKATATNSSSILTLQPARSLITPQMPSKVQVIIRNGNIATSTVAATPQAHSAAAAAPLLKEIKEEIVDLEEDEEEDIKPDINELLKIVEAKENQQESLRPKAAVEFQEPPLKIQKIESISESGIAGGQRAEQSDSATAAHSPGHWSEHSDQDDEELPKQIRNYDDALKLLKPLEEFAMLEENYRVIGLITQLEEIFKNAPKKPN